jgi:hypothetical protein
MMRFNRITTGETTSTYSTSRDSQHRAQAAYVLVQINSAKSQAVLRDYATHGHDRPLAHEYGYW